LSLSLAERFDAAGAPAGIAGAVEYATALYDAATIAELTRRWARLIDAATADPDRSIGALDVFEPGAPPAWQAAAPAPAPATLPELFERQVAATPDAVAVIEAGTGAAWTYAALDARAGQIARGLAAQGIG